MIPENIKREDIIKGAERIIEEGIPKNAHSSTYDVFYKNKLLPPKLLISYANKFRNGIELDRNTFEGGIETQCFKILRDNGFIIYKKDDIFPLLVKFLDQANTGDLKTSEYPKKIKGLDFVVSFGKGNQALIPWISLLLPPNKTSNGIYPVYLLYKNISKLILAYGISETKGPSFKWHIDNPQTIRSYFIDNKFGEPKRYGDSLIYKIYDIKAIPSQDVIENDLNQIIQSYKVTSGNLFSTTTSQFEIHTFNNDLREAGLFFNERLVTQFISSLITKPFLILTGLSGSGKTKLVQAFAQWLCKNESQYCLVPVGADWTNREPLLGYPNALNPEVYIKPDNGALDIVIQANKHPELPFFLILDEMNLSHVERYFADFLSVMESKCEISLFADRIANNGVPAKLALPPNLFIIGTVNIDETTYMFSPKVLDRANAIEFRVTKNEIENFFANQKNVDMSKLKTQGASMAIGFLKMAQKLEFLEQDLNDTHKTLVNFFEQLKKAGAEFGYRSASEIIRLINQLSFIDAGLSANEKLDIAIMQKLLPKLHGSRRKLCPVLITIGRFCVDNTKIENIEKDIFAKEDFDFEADGVIYPISLEKITRMHKGAIENGFASYAEA